MSSIGSIGSSYGSGMMHGMGAPRRPDPAAMAEELFAKIDSGNKGYIEESDLASALSQLGDSSETSAGSLFEQLDGDGDGKVTEDEFSSALTSVSQQLDAQFDEMRMQGGMPPPPPPAGDTGFTQAELESQLSEIGDTDSVRAELISTVIENFDAADTDGDGKVTFQEAMAYASGDDTTSLTTESAAASASSSAASNDLALMQQIMRLASAYGIGGRDDSSLLASA